VWLPDPLDHVLGSVVDPTREVGPQRNL
jgi:hypothetical protein